MAERLVWARHDDGHDYPAYLLHQYRAATGWRAVVRYTVAPGMQYIRGVPIAALRAFGDPTG